MPPQRSRETREIRFHTPTSLLLQLSSPAKTPSTTADFQRQTDKLLRLLQEGTPLSVSQQKQIGKAILSAQKYVLDGFILRNQLEELHTAMVEKARRRSVKRQYLQKGGVMAVKNSQQIILDKQQRASKPQEQIAKTSQMATAALQELQGLLGTQETQETEEIQRL